MSITEPDTTSARAAEVYEGLVDLTAAGKITWQSSGRIGYSTDLPTTDNTSSVRFLLNRNQAPDMILLRMQPEGASWRDAAHYHAPDARLWDLVVAAGMTDEAVIEEALDALARRRLQTGGA